MDPGFIQVFGINALLTGIGVIFTVASIIILVFSTAHDCFISSICSVIYKPLEIALRYLLDSFANVTARSSMKVR